ncbi:hypothetical protein [Halorubrum sp. PV6]|uniref:DUF7857 domain-containing protein n=1 Tax=Halorubrum sp. PV6 TaxID=634157 RepID=UPI000F8527E8|nr:hypothetical protein [Halorubrum sp. PV6]AZQ15756.1 hypothetical protein DOS48_13380 [Halorubrum sp. PV6]
MELSWDVDRAGDVSLVRGRVCNEDDVPRRVRVESRFDAPVLPPRRGGVPASGWDDSGATLRLDSGAHRPFGFAVRAPPVDPPVEVAEAVPLDPAADTEPSAVPTTAALRQLGEHRPPRAAVIGETDEPDRVTDSDAGDTANAGDIADDALDSSGRDESKRERGDRPRSPTESGGWAAAVDSRLDAIEARIDRAERLTDADVATATDVVADADGIAALSGLDDRVAADAERLREVSERAAELAARAEATDAPIAALERLA